MKNIFVLTISTLLIAGYSCKCCKKGGKDEKAAASTSTTSTSGSAATSATATSGTDNSGNKSGANTYRVVVEFYNIGEGPDFPSMEKFEAFLNNYPKKVEFENIQWGRGGEHDFCIKLTGFSEKEQTEFIIKAKDIVKNSKLVHFNENAECAHKQN